MGDWLIGQGNLFHFMIAVFTLEMVGIFALRRLFGIGPGFWPLAAFFIAGFGIAIALYGLFLDWRWEAIASALLIAWFANLWEIARRWSDR